MDRDLLSRTRIYDFSAKKLYLYTYSWMSSSLTAAGVSTPKSVKRSVIMPAVQSPWENWLTMCFCDAYVRASQLPCEILGKLHLKEEGVMYATTLHPQVCPLGKHGSQVRQRQDLWWLVGKAEEYMIPSQIFWKTHSLIPGGVKSRLGFSSTALRGKRDSKSTVFLTTGKSCWLKGYKRANCTVIADKMPIHHNLAKL